MKQQKATKRHIQNRLSIFLPFFLIGLIWISGGKLMYQTTQTELQKQIDKVWNQIILIDCLNRLDESGMSYIRKGTEGALAAPAVSFETEG